MSITGTGTENNPYVVTTFAELASKTELAGIYVKIGCDINILDEYPNGNMPTIYLNAEVDGNGAAISNWYKTSGNCISIGAGHLRNLNCTNLNVAGSFFHCDSGNHNLAPRVVNCRFSGVCTGVFSNYTTGSYSYYPFSFDRCAFKIKSTNYFASTRSKAPMFTNCNVDFTSTAKAMCFVSTTTNDGDALFKDSLVTADMPNMVWVTAMSEVNGYDSYIYHVNSVFDIKTSGALAMNASFGKLPSIINLTHGPNAKASGSMKGVTEENWLNVEYLQSIGFNAG